MTDESKAAQAEREHKRNAKKKALRIAKQEADERSGRGEKKKKRGNKNRAGKGGAGSGFGGSTPKVKNI